MPKLVAACCALHNICEIHVDTFDKEWLEGVEAVSESDTAEAGSQSASGESIRRALMAYFEHGLQTHYYYCLAAKYYIVHVYYCMIIT